MKVEISTDPKKSESDILSQGIIDFNKSEVPDLEPNEAEVKFFVLARNEDDTVVGGIRAICFWNTLHIELLWLSDECRGNGIGKEILESAEAFATQNGCAKAFVETTSWQAKPFYERNGYKLVATLQDRPKGHASHYLAKKLSVTA